MKALFAPISLASLAVFRIGFGACLFFNVLEYFYHDKIGPLYIEPALHFTYYGFEWVKPWPGDGMYWHFYALALLSVGILVGYRYRLCLTLFTLGFLHLFLMDQAYYLNHYYLMLLLCFILLFLPAHRAYSLDAQLRPHLRADTMPAWCLWWLRLQLAVVYVYGGLNKIHPDWFQGEPIRAWLAKKSAFPVVGPYLTWEPVVALVSYGGLLFDLTAVPLLLWRRTRWLGVALSLCFHLANAALFHIGIFPWMMIAATTLFLEPDWPLRLFRRGPPAAPVAVPAGRPRWVKAGLGAYFTLQILLPVRHVLYPGDVDWTTEGYYFSWRMMLVRRMSEGAFHVTDKVTGTTWAMNPLAYLNLHQVSILRYPEATLQFSRFLKELCAREGYPDVEVRAQMYISLNNRPFRPLIDPGRDLGSEPRTFLLPKGLLLAEPEDPLPPDRRFF